MDIKKIDGNFAQEKTCGDQKFKLYTLPCKPLDLYGVFYDEDLKTFLRLPHHVAEATSPNVAMLNKMTSGGRVRFSTDADSLYISARWENKLEPCGNMPLTGQAGFVLLEEAEDRFYYAGKLFPNAGDQGVEGSFSILRGMRYGNAYLEVQPETEAYVKQNSGKMKSYILYFPTYNDVTSLTIGFPEGATVKQGKRYADIPPIVYYGSSITQGGAASRADTCYPAHISKWTNVDYLNFGFSGNAKGESVLAEYLATIPASVFVMDYDHNPYTRERLKQTHYPFYKIYRNANPTTPIIFISKPDGESDFTSRQRFEIIKESYRKAIAEGDKNVYLIDGDALFGDKDRECCFSDGTHPNDLGFYRMAEGIYPTIKKILKL